MIKTVMHPATTEVHEVCQMVIYKL